MNTTFQITTTSTHIIFLDILSQRYFSVDFEMETKDVADHFFANQFTFETKKTWLNLFFFALNNHCVPCEEIFPDSKIEINDDTSIKVFEKKIISLHHQIAYLTQKLKDVETELYDTKHYIKM